MNQPSLPDTNQEERNPLSPLLRWGLLVALILSAGIAFTVADSNQATAFGLRNRESSSPISPMPDPTPVIYYVNPSAGVNTVVVVANIYGQNFTRGGIVFLQYSKDQSTPGGSTPRPRIPVKSEFVNTSHIVAKIPAQVDGQPLKPGYYDVGIQYPKHTPILVRAYRVLTPNSLNDLYAEPYHLISIPGTLKVGEPVNLSLKVHRLGGTAGTGMLDVQFYIDSIAPENLIGTGTVPGISPDSTANSSSVQWTPNSRGEVKLIAVIDSGNAVSETNEENNIVTAKRQVRQPFVQDSYPPTVEDLRVNGGAKEVNEPEVMLEATVTDLQDPNNPDAPVTGASRIYYVELHWYSGTGNGGSWIPVNWTSWLAYDSAPHDFTLHPTAGLRYLQAWGADAAGNISALPAARRLTYMPNQDEISAGEIRVYRQDVDDGQCLTIETVPTAPTMDPDLYVWAPDETLAGSSLAEAGVTDRVVVNPTAAGVYQIEVEGYTDAVYSITIEVTNSCANASATESRAVSAKVQRSQPAIPVTEEPAAEEAPAPQDQIVQFLSFVSMISSNIRSNTTFDVYLPQLQAAQ